MTNQESSTTNANVGEQTATVASSGTQSKSAAKPNKRAKQARKAATTAKPKGTPKQPAQSRKAGKGTSPRRPGQPKAETKGATILALISRAKGASLPELMKKTGWQAHSVRGFLSTATKKQKIKITSEKNEAGDRIYTAK